MLEWVVELTQYGLNMSPEWPSSFKLWPTSLWNAPLEQTASSLRMDNGIFMLTVLQVAKVAELE